MDDASSDDKVNAGRRVNLSIRRRFDEPDFVEAAAW
jgi:hypothetical protein